MPKSEVLQLVKAVVDPEKGPEERQNAFEALAAMIRAGPDVAISLSDPFSANDDVFESFLGLISSSGPAESESLLSILKMMVGEIGMSMPHFRKTLLLAFCEQGWSAKAVQILQMKLSLLNIGDALQPTSSFFWLEGSHAGIYLGGNSDWFLNEGYTFEAKVWKENCPENANTTLFAVLSSEDYHGRESFLIRVHLKSSRVKITIGDKAAALEFDSGLALPSCEWCNITVSHYHDKRIMKPSQLIVAVNNEEARTAVRYPSAMGRIRAYFGCSGYQSALQGSGSFRGLARDVRFWARAFSAEEVKRARGGDSSREQLAHPLFAASAGSLPFLSESMEKCSELPELDSNSRCLGEVTVLNNYHAVEALENLGGMKVLLLLLLASFRIPNPTGKAETLACTVLDLMHNFLLLTDSLPTAVSEGGEGCEWLVLVSGFSNVLFELPLECRTREVMERVCKITRSMWERSKPSSTPPPSAQGSGQADVNLAQHFVKVCLLNGREWSSCYQEGFSGCLLEHAVGWSRSDPQLLLHTDDLAGILLRLSSWHACKEAHANDCPLCVQMAECCCNLLVHSSEIKAQLDSLKILLVGRMNTAHTCKVALLTFMRYLEHYNSSRQGSLRFPSCPADLATISIFIMKDRRSFDKIFATALRVLALHLISSSDEVKRDFESSGGYKTLQMSLCSRELDGEQQDVCVRCLLIMVVEEEVDVKQDLKGEVRNTRALEVLLAFLEVCCNRVRKAAVNDVATLLRTSANSCKRILEIPSWPDRFLTLIHGIGEEEGKNAGEDLFPSVDLLFSRIISSMAGTEEGNSAMQEIFFAFGRYRGSVQAMEGTDFELSIKKSAWRILDVIVDRVKEEEARTSAVIAGGVVVCLYCNIFLHFTEENRVGSRGDAEQSFSSSPSHPWREICLSQFEEVQKRHDRAGTMLLNKLLPVMKKLLDDLERKDSLQASVFCMSGGLESSSPLMRPSRWLFCLFSLTLSMVLHEVREALEEDVPPHLLARLQDHLAVLELSCRLKSDSNDGSLFATAAVVAMHECCKTAAKKLSNEDGERGGGGGGGGESGENLKRLIRLLAARAISFCQLVDQPMIYNLFAGFTHRAAVEQRVQKVEKEGGLEVLHAPLEGGLAAFSEYYGGEEEEDPMVRREEVGKSLAALADDSQQDRKEEAQDDKEGRGLQQSAADRGGEVQREGESKEGGEEDNPLAAFESVKWSLPEVAGHVRSSEQLLHRMSANWRVMWNEKIVEGERSAGDEAVDASMANHLKSSFELMRGRCSKTESIRVERTAQEVEELRIKTSCHMSAVVNMVEPIFCQAGDVFSQLCIEHGIFNKNALHLSRLCLDFKENSRRQRYILRRNDEFVEYKRRDVAKLEKMEKRSVPTILKETVAKIISLTRERKGAEGYESTEEFDSGDEQQNEQVQFDDDEWTDVALQGGEAGEEGESVKVDRDLNLLLLECCARMITVSGICHGTFSLYSSSIVFKPDSSRTLSNLTMRDDEASLKSMMQRAYCWDLSDLTELQSRRYMHRTSALELFFMHQPPVLLDFSHVELSGEGGEEAKCGGGDRYVNQAKKVYKEILKQRKKTSLRRSFFRNPRRALLKYKLQEMWIDRRLSNFEYLMLLNSFAGRSHNDLTQYPVFPWILQDHTSNELDLTQAASFRDLSKPIGAQHEQQVAKLQERFEGMQDVEQQPFHYGTHYSTPGYVLWYLIRLEPFTKMAVHLQGGHFDVPDRLFWSVGETFKNCTTSINDVKELIPEFFYLPEFLLNRAAQDFGETQSRGRVSHVVLPPWAKGDSTRFVHMMRLALESEQVSSHLHEWVDLVFGHKQQGAEAVKATNVFHFLSYENQVDLEKISDPEERRAVEAQIADYGQTPRQLFRSPHPRRKESNSVPRPIFYDILLFRGLVDERRKSSSPVFGTFTSFPIASSGTGSPGMVVGGTYGNSLLTISVDGVVERWAWDANVSSNGRPFKAEKISDAHKVSPLQAAKSVAKGVKGFMQTGDLPSLSSIFSASKASLAPLLGGGSAWGYAHGTCVCLPRHPSQRCEQVLIFQGGFGGGEVVVYTCSPSSPPKKTQTRRLHSSCVTCIATSERYEGLVDVRLITGGADGCVKIWKLLLTQSTLLDRQVRLSNAPLPCLPVAVLNSHVSPVICLSVCMPIDLLVDGSADGRITVHRMSTSEHVKTIRCPSKLRMEVVRIIENGLLLAYSRQDNLLRAYALAGDEIASFSFGSSVMTCLTASSCGNYVFAGESTGNIRILEVPFLSELQTLSPTNSTGRVDFIVLSPCNNYLLCGYRSGHVELVTDKGQLLDQKKKALEDLGIYGLL